MINTVFYWKEYKIAFIFAMVKREYKVQDGVVLWIFMVL